MAKKQMMMRSAKTKGQDVRQVVRSILESRIEHKRITAVGAAADIPTAGVVQTISMAVAQGDDIGNRSGDLIRPKKLLIKAEFNNSQAATSTVISRVIVFQDRFCNGATPAVTDLLSAADVLSSWNVTNKQANRFKVLKDETFSMVGQSIHQTHVFTWKFPMKGTIHYLGSTAAAASQGANSLFVLFIGSAANAAYDYAWSYDLEYTDA